MPLKNKEQRKLYQQEYYKKNKDKLNRYGRQYRLANFDKLSEYDKTKRVVNKEDRQQRILKHRAKYPQRYKCDLDLNNALKAGKVIKLPCQVCGDKKSQGHHHDYSKPLSVIWLCALHHKAVHSKRRSVIINNYFNELPTAIPKRPVIMF